MKSQLLASSLVVALVLAVSPVHALAEDEHVKLAATARFDVMADAHVGVLDNGKVVAGNGTIARMNWVPESEQPRGYTVNFPVTHRSWKPLAVHFTPVHDGTVTLSLMGPWEQASPGVVYRQEVLWDDLSADGAALTDGGFESRRGARAGGWQSGGGSVVEQSTGVAAVEGTHYARTWHNQTLSTSFKVVGGRPVTIRVSARAVRPEGLIEMKRLTSRTTPAHLAARRFRRGANLGNGLETPPGQDWGGHYSPTDLRIMRAEGFDHVRIPAGWHHYTGPGPEFRIRPEFFGRVDELVNAGLREGLAVLINIHHFDDFTSHPKEQTPRFLAIWRQIAEHYSRAPEGLALELLNEPKDAATTEVINPIFAEAIRQIRRIDPKRTIFLGPSKWNSISELAKLQLPDDDDNLIVTVHNYEPFYFTHQGATWAGPDTKVTGILFPGPPAKPLSPDPSLKVNSGVLNWIKAYNTQPTATNPSSAHAFQGAVDQAREWSEYYGRPIHVGEFGCFTTADSVSRANYYRALRESAETAGFGWAIWDWKAGFHYWNEKTNKAEPGMHDALFGTSSSRTIH
ncbi:MAG TPA: glycoside hydrolase family 5 protein [Isosphaeraceae bacterium]|nr:glycoside hydrolase family 5 protein [Isosphaeraceae bacterium]